MRNFEVDYLIVGAGISGLIAAIRLKELVNKDKILVLEKGDSKTRIRPILLTLASKVALKSIESLRQIKFNLSRYNIFKVSLENTDILFDSENISIINYSDILFYLQNIAKLMNINIEYNNAVLTLNVMSKYVNTAQNDTIKYKNLILARGPVDQEAKINIFEPPIYINSDISMYRFPFPKIFDKPSSNIKENVFEIVAPVQSSLPSKSKGLIRIGSSGGFIDFLTYESLKYKIEAAIVAAETIILKDCGIDTFFDKMATTITDIRNSLILRKMLEKKPELINSIKQDELITLLKNIIFYNTQLYDELVKLLIT